MTRCTQGGPKQAALEIKNFRARGMLKPSSWAMEAITAFHRVVV